MGCWGGGGGGGGRVFSGVGGEPVLAMNVSASVLWALCGLCAVVLGCLLLAGGSGLVGRCVQVG